MVKSIQNRYARDGLLGMFISGIGAGIATIVSNPFDVAKTRLQMQNELGQSNAQKIYRGTFHCISKTFSHDGLYGVQRGLCVSLFRTSTKSFFRVGLYDPIMFRIHPTSKPAPIWKRVVAGITCGLVAAILCNPLDLLKTRIQVAGCAMGHHHTITASATISKIVRDHNLIGLWSGTNINIMRSVSFSAVMLPINSRCKEICTSFGVKNGVLRDGSSALLASLVAVYAFSPVDVLRTRLYNQPTGIGKSSVLYTGILDATMKIIRYEGIYGLYKGVVGNYLRIGPHCVITMIAIGWIQRLACKIKKKQTISNEL